MGRLRKGGVPDTNSAGKRVLYDWNAYDILILRAEIDASCSLTYQILKFACKLLVNVKLTDNTRLAFKLQYTSTSIRKFNNEQTTLSRLLCLNKHLFRSVIDKYYTLLYECIEEYKSIAALNLYCNSRIN